MKVIIKIGDREAVPVRAIPLLTHWETMSPDVVAQALAWNEGEPHFKGLQAFRCYEGSRPIPAREWENEVCWQFTALNESMKATGNTPATGLLEWRRRALEILPAGVYVWKDEFEPMHCMRYGPDGETLLKNMVPVDDEARERLVALDFDPVISDPEIQRLVFEGFVPTPAGDAAFTLAFYGTCGGLDIEQWAKKMEVRPLEAARLLCGEDPLNLKAYADSEEVQLLARILEDTAKSHPDGCMLRDFALLALERGASHRHEISKAVVHLTEDAGNARSVLDEASLAPVVADNTSNSPVWTVNKPQRYYGYTEPLYRLLAAAHRDGKLCPTAREVVEAWRNNQPIEIAKVLPDGFDYYDAKGDTKTADLEAIRKAIGRMTIAR